MSRINMRSLSTMISSPLKNAEPLVTVRDCADMFAVRALAVWPESTHDRSVTIMRSLPMSTSAPTPIGAASVRSLALELTDPESVHPERVRSLPSDPHVPLATSDRWPVPELAISREESLAVSTSIALYGGPLAGQGSALAEIVRPPDTSDVSACSRN